MGRFVTSDVTKNDGAPETCEDAAQDSHRARPAPKRARGRPRLEEASLIEADLLERALTIFVSRGYGATTMTAIAQDLKISKTTLYSRYPTKETLFSAIIKTQIAQVASLSGLEGTPDAPLDLQSGLEQFAARMLAVIEASDQLEVDWLILSEARRFPELGEAATQRTRASIDQVAAFIELCAASDGIPCRDAHAIAEVFLQTIRGWFLNTMLAGARPSPEERQAWVRQVVSMMLANRSEW